MRTQYTKKWVKNRKVLTSSYKTWIRIRNVKLIFVACFIVGIVLFVQANEAKRSEFIDVRMLAAKMTFFSCIPFLASMILLAICKELQYSEQVYIDRTLLGKDTYHYAEFFPHTGVWVHRREAFLYYLRTRRFRRAIRKRVAFSLSLRQRRARRLQAFMRRFLNREAGAK